MKLIDIHCHVLPYVDDGAADLEEALELLRTEAQQGVTRICLTPHLRHRMFESSDEKILEKFLQLQNAAREQDVPVKLHLSREYYFDDQFRKILREKKVIPMGGDILLTEFSYSSDYRILHAAAEEILSRGYFPLFAHVERYKAFQDDPECGEPLVEMGVMLQINADSIIGRDGRKTKHLCERLLKTGCIHVVASDAHDTENRIPNLRKCADYLEKKIGRAGTHRLVYENPLAILNIMEEEYSDAESHTEAP